MDNKGQPLSVKDLPTVPLFRKLFEHGELKTVFIGYSHWTGIKSADQWLQVGILLSL
jgi:hypothetical protein